MKAVLSLLVVVALVAAAFADPDADFAQCCKDKGVSDGCSKWCGYGFSSDDVLAAFQDGTCSLDKDGPPFYQCLENLKDNTQCCKDGGVGADSSLAFCLDICDGTKPLVPDLKYMDCKPYEAAILKCGKDSH